MRIMLAVEKPPNPPSNEAVFSLAMNGRKSAASSREQINWASVRLKVVKMVAKSMTFSLGDECCFGLRVGNIFQIGEDDDACAGLAQVLHLHFGLMADVWLAVVDDDHRAVGQIANTLSLVLAF